METPAQFCVEINTQPNLAIEAELQVAVAVLEKFVDDRAFARADYLEESDLRVPH